MASETELERMVIRLLGDDDDYQQTLQDVERATRDSLRQIDKDLEKTENLFKRLGGGIKRVGDGVQTLGKNVSMIGGAFTLLTAPITLYAKSAFDASVQSEKLLLGLTATVGSAEEAAKQMIELDKIALLPGLGKSEAVQGAINLQQVGFEANKTMRILKAFGNAVASTGGGKNELEAIVFQLTQMQASGRVLGEDLKPILQTAPAISRAMKEAFGTVSAGKIGEMGIDSEQFINQLLVSLEKMPPVMGGAANAIENLGDTMARLNKAIGAEIKALVLPSLHRFAELIQWLTAQFQDLTPEMRRAVVVVGLVATMIGPAIVFLGGAIALLGFAISGIGAGIAAIGAPLGFFLASITAVGVAVAGVVAALVDWGAAWEGMGTTFRRVQKNVEGFVANFQENMQILAEWIRPTVNYMVDSFFWMVNQIRAAFGSLLMFIEQNNWLKWIADNTRLAVTVAVGLFVNFGENFQKVVKWMWNNWWKFGQDWDRLQIVMMRNWIYNVDVAIQSIQLAILELRIWFWRWANSNFNVEVGKKLMEKVGQGAMKHWNEQSRGLLQGFVSTFENLPKLNISWDADKIFPTFKWEKGENPVKEELEDMGDLADDVGRRVAAIMEPLTNDLVREGTEEYRQLLHDSVRLLDQQPVGRQQAERRVIEFGMSGTGSQKMIGVDEPKKNTDLLDDIKEGINRLVELNEQNPAGEVELGLGEA